MPAPGMDDLNHMLVEGRFRLGAEEATHQVVMGNESADLDSLVSALVYGWYGWFSQGDSGEIWVPVMNIPRADLALRRDAAFLFAETGVDTSRLVFCDDIDMDGLHRLGRLRLTLVDHHQLAEDQKTLADAVVAVVDHHPDAGTFLGLARRQVEPVGSTATLVAERILAHAPDRLTPQLAALLLGPILTDTANLDPGRRTVTPKDRTAAEALRGRCMLDADRFYRRLVDLRMDIGGLSLRQILRKDYKVRSIGSLRLGISSVPMSLGQLTAMEGDWAGGLGAFAREQELDLFVLMLYHDGPRFERELVAVDAGGGLWVRGLDALRAGGVELEASRCGQGRPQVRCYAQVDPRFSRKQILHLLQKGLGAPASGAP